MYDAFDFTINGNVSIVSSATDDTPVVYGSSVKLNGILDITMSNASSFINSSSLYFTSSDAKLTTTATNKSYNSTDVGVFTKTGGVKGATWEVRSNGYNEIYTCIQDYTLTSSYSRVPPSAYWSTKCPTGYKYISDISGSNDCWDYRADCLKCNSWYLSVSDCEALQSCLSQCAQSPDCRDGTDYCDLCIYDCEAHAETKINC